MEPSQIKIGLLFISKDWIFIMTIGYIVKKFYLSGFFMDSPLQKFEVTASAAYGYQCFWIQRVALMRMMLFPFLIKIGCYAAILLLGLEDHYLRHGLMLLPSFFAEGFLLAVVIRIVMSDRNLRGDLAQMRAYSRDIIAAMLSYVLIQLSVAFFVGTSLNVMQRSTQVQNDPALPDQGRDAPAAANADGAKGAKGAGGDVAEVVSEPSIAEFMMLMAMIALMIWAFRLIWLYVPIAMGVGAKRFLWAMRPYHASFKLMGVWLLCFLPIGFGMLLLAEILRSAFPSGGDGADTSLGFTIVFTFVQSGAEMVVGVIASLAMAYGVKSMMSNGDCLL